MIDVATVGAGGGSIARRAVDGRLRVGPDSAGADPGPMCYARGGQSPTVTDAALVLGRIPPHLLGGEIPLDPHLALARVWTAWRLPRPVSGASRTGRARNRGVESGQCSAPGDGQTRGFDVRDYQLVAFGGSGPLQAGKLVDILGLQGALIPPDPGNVSAFGLLTVDVKNDYVATSVQRDDLLDVERARTVFARLESQAREALATERFSPTVIALQRWADLRYFGQAWEVRVEVAAGSFDRAAADEVVRRFHAAHARTYGYSYADSADQRIEWVNLRVVGVGPIRRPRVTPRQRDLRGGVERALVGTRQVGFDEGLLSASIYTRARLQPGDRLLGPSIVEEFGSTTVVFPGLEARVDDFGDLLLAPTSA